ncbi:Peroxisomal membrane protein 11C-like [Homarus americanus]|uniref:Peroxisomal membrane protein 11C-like n=1 Tax=Homarus americanus TaxID=6706 RepID=A0A8J5K0U6_HOMAM|nr:Peroxisomal membrane protein 11C-like [Homarus americanus]
MGLQEIVTVLETYRGREKTLRTVQYGLLLLTPLAKENTRTALQTVSSQFGMARVILRLFDDLPMLQYSWSCIRSTKGKDTFLRCLELTNIAVDQLYFPLEHIAWARDMKVLKGNSASLWHASLLLWGLSLVLTIVRDRVDAMYKAELLTVIMQAANLLNALNWMPRRPWTKPF